MHMSAASHSRFRILGWAIVALFLLVTGFQNCSKASFSADSAASKGSNNDTNGNNGGLGGLGNNDDEAYGVITQTGGPNCRDELKSLTVPVKMFFVVDVSGSNFENQGPGSDPDKVVRGGSMTRFFNSYSTKSNFAWGMITFAGSSATTLAANSSAASMSGALSTFMQLRDSGSTPYIAALNETKNRIAADTGRAPGTKYVVVFLSDGLPNPMVSDANLNSAVTSILNTVPGQISFNTVYYGRTDAAASGRLRMMSQTGGGNFLDTNTNPTGQAFLISDLINIPGVVCQ